MLCDMAMHMKRVVSSNFRDNTQNLRFEIIQRWAYETLGKSWYNRNNIEDYFSPFLKSHIPGQAVPHCCISTWLSLNLSTSNTRHGFHLNCDNQN